MDKITSYRILPHFPGGIKVDEAVAPGRRMNNWMVTASGRRISITDPQPEDICIHDIAHALANICRFGGHTKRFYSVAQHSIMVSDEVDNQHALQGLLHDATEAYLGDVVGPLKRVLPDYLALEKKWRGAICEAFHISVEIPGEVKVADNRAMSTELRDLFGRDALGRQAFDLAESQPYGYDIASMPSGTAMLTFLCRFDELT